MIDLSCATYRLPQPVLAILPIVHNVMLKLMAPMLIAGIITTISAADAAPPALFFYPPPVQLPDGSVISSPVTFSVPQITTLFPEIEEMAGVALIVNWSQLCPKSDECDFSMIDQTLSYWGARGKKVILAVATVGYPYRSLEGGKPHYANATPEWVLDKVTTYQAETSALGHVDNQLKTTVRFPSYADPNLAKLITALVQKLGRYDGNPVVAQVRISTGFLTEDNPSPAGPKWLIPGYTDLDWIGYCHQMTQIFTKVFHRSQLEFDFGVVALAYERGSPSTRHAVDHFVDELIAHKIFLAFDGLQSSTAGAVDQGQTKKEQEVPRILYYLKRANAAYHGAGLEEMEPISADRMQDIDALEHAIQAVQPSRLVMFSVSAGALNRERRGTNSKNQLATQWLDAQPNGPAANTHLHQLLSQLGYH